MNALLFGLMSTALMGVAVARGPEAVESKPVPAAHIEQIRAETTPAIAQISRAEMSEEAKAAADDLEVARLMEAAKAHEADVLAGFGEGEGGLQNRLAAAGTGAELGGLFGADGGLCALCRIARRHSRSGGAGAVV